MRGRSLALLFILASLASLAPAAPAGAAVGDLSYRGCIAESEDFGCQAHPELLQDAAGIALSRDGSSLYLASFDTGTLTAFDRGDDGALSFSNCASESMLPVCTDLLPATSAEDAFGVAVSPDDASVYMTSISGDAVLHFFREPDGTLAFGGCISSEFLQGCADAAGDPIDAPMAVAVGPDSDAVYVGSANSSSVSHFFRDPDGQLNFGGCVADAEDGGCEDLDDAPLSGVRDVEVSPDGRFVYVTGSNASSIARFELEPGGQLVFDGCLGEGDESGCADPPGEHLLGAHGLAISPDGRFLYVAGAFADTVVQYAIDGAGRLGFVSCLSSGGSGGACTRVPPLFEPRSIAISPDGHSAYVGTRESSALVHFSRDPGNGRLTFASCFSSDVDGVGCIEHPGRPLGAPEHLAVSPDGTSVYVSDLQTGAILIFSRSLGDPAPPRPPVGPPPPPPPPPPRPTARCAGKPATIVGTPRADTLRGTPRRDVIAALGGADQIRGLGGKDLICGGKGKDTILGGSGEDRCLGGAGADKADCERGRGRRG